MTPSISAAQGGRKVVTSARFVPSKWRGFGTIFENRAVPKRICGTFRWTAPPSRSLTGGASAKPNGPPHWPRYIFQPQWPGQAVWKHRGQGQTLAIQSYFLCCWNCCIWTAISVAKTYHKYLIDYVRSCFNYQTIAGCLVLSRQEGPDGPEVLGTDLDRRSFGEGAGYRLHGHPADRDPLRPTRLAREARCLETGHD